MSIIHLQLFMIIIEEASYYYCYCLSFYNTYSVAICNESGHIISHLRKEFVYLKLTFVAVRLCEEQE